MFSLVYNDSCFSTRNQETTSKEEQFTLTGTVSFHLVQSPPTVMLKWFVLAYKL